MGACIINTQEHGGNCRRNKLHMSLKITMEVVMKTCGWEWGVGISLAVGSVYDGLKHWEMWSSLGYSLFYDIIETKNFYSLVKTQQ